MIPKYETIICYLYLFILWHSETWHGQEWNDPTCFSISKLRKGILPLQPEVGRLTNKTVEDRLCLICNYGTEEDEEHFIFHCNFYYGEHENVYNYMKNNIPNFNNL